MNNVCFFVDEMLFYVAEYLRFMGYSAIYLKGLEDKEIIKMINSSKKNAILITGDRTLASVAKNNAIEVFFIYPQKTYFSLYFKDLVKKYKLKFRNNPRCTKCDGVLIKKRKEELNEEEIKQAKEVINRYAVFFSCEKCKKIYWKGSHWKSMIRNIKNLLK